MNQESTLRHESVQDAMTAPQDDLLSDREQLITGLTPLLDEFAPKNTDSETVRAVRAAVLTYGEATAEAHVMVETTGVTVDMKAIDDRFIDNINVCMEEIKMGGSGLLWNEKGDVVDPAELAQEVIEAMRPEAIVSVGESLDQEILVKKAELERLEMQRQKLNVSSADEPVVETIVVQQEVIPPMEPVFDDSPKNITAELHQLSRELHHIGSHVLHLVMVM